MIIGNIQTKFSYTPSFKHYAECREPVDNYKYATTTFMLRDDLDWEAFARLLDKKYKNVDNVNLINHACSDGEEPYSLALTLLAKLGKSAEKFFPIIAKDFDNTSLLFAKKGRFNINKKEHLKLERTFGLNLYKYLNIREDQFGIHVKVNDNLKERIIFQKSDILKDVENLPKENTVLLCRNFWPYMPQSSKKLLAQKLATRLDSSSLIVIGSFDISNGIDKLLEEVGFEMTEVKGVMQKRKNNARTYISLVNTK